eukprot:7968819-Alexandrium_andersonii.AAC.1
MQNPFRRSELELRGPRTGLKYRWMRSAPLLAQIPNPPTKAGIEGVRFREMANVSSSNPQYAREP